MSQTTTTTTTPVTVVLVHGAFADSSSWAGVIERLHAADVQVIAAANPLRGISADSAYLASVFAQVPGPVLAVAIWTPPRATSEPQPEAAEAAAAWREGTRLLTADERARQERHE